MKDGNLSSMLMLKWVFITIVMRLSIFFVPIYYGVRISEFMIMNLFPYPIRYHASGKERLRSVVLCMKSYHHKTKEKIAFLKRRSPHFKKRLNSLSGAKTNIG